VGGGIEPQRGLAALLFLSYGDYDEIIFILRKAKHFLPGEEGDESPAGRR
jgi:hypothetical protein